MNDAERTVLVKMFRKVALQTEQQLQAAATRLCDNVVDSFKAQTILFNQQTRKSSQRTIHPERVWNGSKKGKRPGPLQLVVV